MSKFFQVHISSSQAVSHLVASGLAMAALYVFGSGASALAALAQLSLPGHADKLPASGGRCDCTFEWRCLPHDMCFIHDSCLCDGSGSYPPVKPPRD